MLNGWSMNSASPLPQNLCKDSPNPLKRSAPAHLQGGIYALLEPAVTVLSCLEIFGCFRNGQTARRGALVSIQTGVARIDQSRQW